MISRNYEVLTIMDVAIEPGDADAWAEGAHPDSTVDPQVSITEPVPGIAVTYDPRLDDLAVVHTIRLRDQGQDTDEIPWTTARDVMDALQAQRVLDPGLSFEDEIDVSFVRSGVKGPEGRHIQWVEEIRFEANATFDGIVLLDAGLRIGITPAHEVSSLRITRIEFDPLDTVAIEASDLDLRESFAEHVAGTTSATFDAVVVDERWPVYVLGLGQDTGDVEPWYGIRYSLFITDGDSVMGNRATMVFLSLLDRPPSVELRLP